MKYANTILESKISIIVLILLLNNIDPSISKPTQNDEQSKQEGQITARENEIHLNDEDYEYRVNYAQKMLTYMNMSVDPCDDFYEFACGNWKNVKEKKDTQHQRSNFRDIEYKILGYVAEILQNSSNNSNIKYKPEFEIAQKFYQSCLSADLYTIKRSPEYLEVIKSIGGFPAVDETWNPETFSWFNMSAHLTNYGASGLINEIVIPYYPFPPYLILPEIGFAYNIYSDNIASNTSKSSTMNKDQMRKYLTTYGVEESKITEVISEIFDFWKAVLKINDQFDEDLEKCQMKDVNSTFTELDNYFAIAWGKDFNSTFAQYSCEFFYIELDKVCQKHKKAVANYLAMKFLFAMDANLKYPDHQKDYCVRSIKNTMPYLIDRFYLKDHFSNEVSEEVSSIFKELRESLLSELREADWLDDSTRTAAMLIVSAIITRAGNYEDNEMTERLIREMNNLTFVDGNYCQNNINLHEFNRYMYRYNGLHSDIFDNSTKPLELLIGVQVRTFYYTFDNSINVMAGILNPPVYHKAWPNSLKYGTLGYLVGHEYTHGFDHEAKFGYGLEKLGTAFQKRFNCYVNHFNSYLIPEINRNVDGKKTLEENIADSGGIRSALTAYRNLIKNQSETDGIVSKSEQMPGMDLSPEQLFFLGFAQLWCASYEEEHFWEEVNDGHPINRYRVLGTVTNYHEFASAYNCAEGTKMNPKDKCRMW